MIGEYRELFSQNELTVRAWLCDDDDSAPFGADCYSAADIAAWRRDNWQYVTIEVSVRFDGVQIGQDSLSGVEHGTLGDGTTVDALAWAVPEYGTAGEFAKGVRTIMAGSPLNSVVIEALTSARAWLARHFTPTSRAMDDVNDALTWADPSGTMPGFTPEG